MSLSNFAGQSKPNKTLLGAALGSEYLADLRRRDLRLRERNQLRQAVLRDLREERGEPCPLPRRVTPDEIADAIRQAPHLYRHVLLDLLAPDITDIARAVVEEVCRRGQ